jgi:hypothetical protein
MRQTMLTDEAIDEIAAHLETQPKKEKGATTREAVGRLRPHILRLRADGYAWDEILAMLQHKGVSLTLNTLRDYLKPQGSNGVKAGNGKSAARTQRRATLTATSDATPIEIQRATPRATSSEIEKPLAIKPRDGVGTLAAPAESFQGGGARFKVRPDSEEL